MKKKIYKVCSLALTLLLVGALVLTVGCGGGGGQQGGQSGGGQSGGGQAQAGKTEILIGRVNPTTGPIAGFGKGTPFIEEKALEAINAEGGIYIKEYDKKLPVRIIVADSESSDVKAAEAASKLILQDKVDIMIATHTPATVNPVAAASERNGIPCITLESPGEAWLEGGPYKWAFHAHFLTSSLVEAFLDAFDTFDTNKKIGLAAGNDTDGVLMSSLMAELAPKRGYTIVDPGRFPVNTKDYTSLISKFKEEGCDIVYGNMITPDFMTMFQQFHQQGYVPKALGMSRAILFPTDVEALGDIGEGLITEVWWGDTHPFKSSLTGQTAAELCKMYTDETGEQFHAGLGFKHANIEVVIDVLKRAQTLNKEELLKAIAETDLDTIVGHIKYNDQHFSEIPVTIGQWQKGEKWPYEIVIFSNTKIPEVPLSDKKVIFPLPGSTR